MLEDVICVKLLKQLLGRTGGRGKGCVYSGHLLPHVADAVRASGGKQISGELDAVLARWLESRLEVVPEEEWKYDDQLDQVESALLGKLLDRFDNRPTHLAQALRMNRATLRQKLRRLGIREGE